MEWGKPVFIMAMVTVCAAAWLINNWIRARHGYALDDGWGGKTHRPDQTAATALKLENEALNQRIEALELRAATLEAIVTDSGYQTAARIEALRDPVASLSSRHLETRHDHC